MSPKDGPRRVCELCRGRAERLGWVDPAAPGANVGRRESVPGESPQGRLDRAVAHFNGSEAARTIAGLMRTLGVPWVSVGAAAGSRSEVRITVAWELSWYQWGVDLDNELRPVFELDKGHELDQLDGSARQWNATAASGGQLSLGAPAAREPATANRSAEPWRSSWSTSMEARAATPVRRRSGSSCRAPTARLLEERGADRQGDQQRRRVQGPAARIERGPLRLGRASWSGRDSELVVRQVKGEYKVKNPAMRELHAEVKKALRPFERWSIRHVRPSTPTRDDRLVNATLDGHA